MKKLLASLVLFLGLTTVVACSNDSEGQEAGGQEEGNDLVVTISEPVEIEFWHAMSGPNEEVVNQLVETFNTTVGAEKNITVKPVFQGSYADLKSKLTAGIKANEAPVIAQGYPDYTAEFLQSEAVVALDQYINHPEVGITDFEDIAAAYREENNQYDESGTFYSLPFNKSTEVLYYNKTFFEEHGLTVPATWEQVEEVAAQITEITGKPSFGFDSAPNAFITLVQQFGGEYTNSKGEVLFGEGDAAVQALDMIQRNVEAGSWRLAGEDIYMSGPFVSQTTFMHVGSTAGASHVTNENFEWASAPYPQVSEDTKAVIQQGTNVMLLNQGRTGEEIYAGYEFAKFLCSHEGNLQFSTSSGYLPIRQSVVDSEEYQAYVTESNDSTKVSGPVQSEYYFYDPAFFTDTYSSYQVRTEMGVAVENVVFNGMDPQEALDLAKQALGL